jgi:hypothetical protein
MNWQEQLPGFISGVLASLAAMAIGAFLKRAYPALKECLSKMIDASRLAISKISTLLSEISFLATAKRKLTTFAQVVVVGVCRLAVFCFWVVAIYYQVNQITERPNTIRASTVAVSDSRTCYCPKGNVYSSTTTLSRVTRSNCDRANYSATPISLTTDGTELLGDTSPVRTGRYGGSGYSIDDEPQ